MKLKIIAAILLCSFAVGGCVETKSENARVEIHDIQGCSHHSPFEGKLVKDIRGFVTLKATNGFVMQSGQPDDLDCSSEAIFVHTDNYADVVLGEFVSVNGRVAEFTPGTADQNNLSQTEITHASVKVVQGRTGSIAPVVLGQDGRKLPIRVIEDDGMKQFDPESDGLDFYESLEWMLVKLPEMTVVGSRNVYNEIVVVESEMTHKRADDATEAIPIVLTQENLHPERIMIELPNDWKQKINVGDRLVEGVEGVLTYSYGNYKIEPINNVQVEENTPKNREIHCFSGDSDKLRIAIYNLHNYSQYSTLSKIKTIAKQIVSSLCAPDLLILEEVEDDSGELDDGKVSASENLKLLVDQIRASKGPEYLFYDFAPLNNTTGGIVGGNIRTVFLLRNDSKLKLLSSAGDLTQNGTIDIHSQGQISAIPNPMMIGFDDPSFLNSRKPIIGLFSYEGKQVIVVGVHLVSKSANSPLYGNLQPPSEPELPVRLAQAAYIHRWAEEIVKRAPNTIVIIAGDMNDSYDSEVLATMKGINFIDTANDVAAGSRYSIIMDGGASLFDHILISQNLVQYTAKVLHLNTLLDEAKQASDHDPVEISIGPK